MPSVSDKDRSGEVTTPAGSVYESVGVIRIDWTTADLPLPGLAKGPLLRGHVETHPTGGRVVTFSPKVKGKTALVSVRTEGRPELAELADMAEQMQAELNAQARAEHSARMANLEAERQAKREAFRATIPVGYVQLQTEHDSGAADGWGMTSYSYEGQEIYWSEIALIDCRQCEISASEMLAYADPAKLADLVAAKQAEATAREAEKSAKAEALAIDRAAKIAQAVETGKPVELRRWSESCSDPREECDLDVVTEWANPNGTITTTRQHTW